MSGSSKQTTTPEEQIEALEMKLLLLEQENKQLRLAQRATRLNEAKLMEVQRFALISSWEVNAMSGRLTASEGLLNLLGKSEADRLTLEDLMAAIHADDQQAFQDLYDRSLAGGRPFELGHRLINGEGDTLIIDHFCKTFFAPTGLPLKSMGLMQDITELKHTEERLKTAMSEAKAAVQAKSDFLANMSHEIRTPMNAIIGLSHLALQTGLAPKQQDYIHKVYTAAHSLLGIINDILDFSKIEAGKLDMEQVPFRLDKVLEDLAHLVTIKAREKGLELLIRVDPQAPNGLVGDPLRLSQILLNLANNAVKFTEQGEILLEVERIGDVNDSVMMRFSVKDSGIGMNEEQVTRLFQSFSQADASTTRKYGGTGLGLAISKRLTELMGGRIRAESTHGEGSCFTFTARFGLSDEQNDPISDQLPGPDLRGTPILIVDDSPDARRILHELAENLTFDATLAASGEEALELIHKHDQASDPFKLVYMDWKMEGMDGMEASRRIKSDTSLTAPPQVIMVTAYDPELMRQKLDGWEMDGMLTKPVSASTLMDAAMAAMGHKNRTPGQPKQGGALSIAAIEPIRGARILLVEDNAVNQQVAQELLEQAQLEVTVAEHGQKALEILNQALFDAVLMDLQMPIMDGYEATHAIRKQQQFASLPIIAMTANAMAGDREKCLDAGMNDHVAKPIDPGELFAALAHWIEPAERDIPAELLQRHDSDKEPADTQPLELPGFDQKAAIARMGGNVGAFRRTLAKVVNNETTAMARIREALAQGERQTAIRDAHSLKGMAGNIGAMKLFEAAGILENSLSRQHGPLPEKLLSQVERCLAETMRTIETALSVERPDAHVDTPSSQGALEPEQLEALLGQLQRQIENYDSAATESCDALVTLLQGTPLTKNMAEINRALDGYEFDIAQTLMKELRKELDMPRG
ncbi:MAG: response regulator [Magnetococcales bacterium]|nr:response regulator [Magnetococcales bacterium]